MRYAAFLRGIGPSNPNMHNSKVCAVFEALGFIDVKGVLASGNIIFTSDETNKSKLEEQIEEALNKHLGLLSRAIVRSQADLQKIVGAAPFDDQKHSVKTYLTVTFLKHKPAGKMPIPHRSDNGAINIFAYDAGAQAVFGITDATVEKGGKFMAWFEKQFGKDITTRTWLSVQKVLAACQKA